MTTYNTHRAVAQRKADGATAGSLLLVTVIACLLVMASLLFSGCTSADDAEATPEAAVLPTEPLVGDTAWEHTVKDRSTIRVTEANRESGRATVERLEHIAVLLERLIEVQEESGERLDDTESLLDRLF